MKKIRLTPSSRAEWLAVRWQNVSSTESSALFGLNPYMSDCKLWFDKKNRPESFAEEEAVSTRMVWGTRLQDAIAKGVAEDRGWKIRRLNQYLYLPEIRMGSSFDFEIVKNEAETGAGVLEIKNVGASVFRDRWLINGDDPQPPDHIALQVQHQLEVIDRGWAYIAALIGGNDICLIRVERDREIGDLIRKKIADFWASLDADEPPPPADGADALQRWSFATAGLAVPTSPEAIADLSRLKELRELRDSLDKEAEALEVRLKAAMGDAEILIDGRGKPLCTWKNSTRVSLDTTALKAELPDIAARFTKTTQTRIFRLSKLKES
jgi:putative phage-type endonuclease